jgi:cell division protein FtsL
MTNRRRSHAQAAPIRRRSRAGTRGALSFLRLVPNSVAGAAEQSVKGLRPALSRYVDLHPALAVLTAVAIVALVCVIYLSQVTAVTNANYRLQALQQEHTMLLRKQGDLQLQIGKAQSLTTIEQRAREQLKMVPLDDQYTYITIAPGPLAAIAPLPTPALPAGAQAETETP